MCTNLFPLPCPLCIVVCHCHRVDSRSQNNRHYFCIREDGRDEYEVLKGVVVVIVALRALLLNRLVK
jgi:hypothetical protein